MTKENKEKGVIETIKITPYDRMMNETDKSIPEIIRDNRGWLLGETNDNNWRWYLDFQRNLILERRIIL